MKDFLQQLELPVIYTAPYSYLSSPIEMLFGALKFGELNSTGKKTGKKWVMLLIVIDIQYYGVS